MIIKNTLLFSYYAEKDDDPDFVPNLPKKIKKSQSTTIISAEKAKRKLSKVELKCQLCDASFSRVIGKPKFNSKFHYLMVDLRRV